MSKGVYVSELPDRLFCKVYQALKKANLTEDGIAMALNGKLGDLEDIINVREILCEREV